MTQDTNLEQSTPASENGDVSNQAGNSQETGTEQVVENAIENMLYPDATPVDAEETQEQEAPTDESGETTEEVETETSEASESTEDSKDEEKPAEETDDNAEAKTEESNPIDISELDPVSDKMEIDIGGETKKFSINDIKALYGQSKSLDDKSREAKAVQDETEQKLAQLKAKEEELYAQHVVNATSPEIAKVENQMHELSKQLEEADKNDDSDEIAKLSYRYNKAAKSRNDIIEKVNTEKAKLVEVEKQKLTTLGVGDYLEDETKLKTFTTYANKNLTQKAAEAVNFNADLFAMAVKAMKYDEAQGKPTGKVLKANKKLVKSSGKSPTVKKTGGFKGFDNVKSSDDITPDMNNFIDSVYQAQGKKS